MKQWSLSIERQLGTNMVGELAYVGSHGSNLSFPVDINHVRIRFTLTRFAPDFAKRGIHMRIATGTGTLDCAHGLVAGWSQKGP